MYLNFLLNIRTKFEFFNYYYIEFYFQIKYSELDYSDEKTVFARRTRGKKINYQEMTGTDSDDDTKSRKTKTSRLIESDDDFIAENEKHEGSQEEESEEEMESDVEDEENMREDNISENQDENQDENQEQDQTENEYKKNIIKIIEQKNWMIPNWNENIKKIILNEEQLHALSEEFEQLKNEEMNILKKILESGEIPINEINLALKKVKEEKYSNESFINKMDIRKTSQNVQPFLAPDNERLKQTIEKDKFQESEKVITSGFTGSSSQIFDASHNEKNSLPTSKELSKNTSEIHLTEKSHDFEGKSVDLSGGELLSKSYLADVKLQRGSKSSSDISLTNYLNEPNLHSSQSLVSPFKSSDPLLRSSLKIGNVNLNLNSQKEIISDNPSVIRGDFQNKRLNSDATRFTEPTANKLPNYCPLIPATVTGLSNIDAEKESRQKQPCGISDIKAKKKIDNSSQLEKNKLVSKDAAPLSVQSENIFSQAKSNLESSSSLKKQRGRGGKKYVETESRIQEKGGNIVAGHASNQYPSQNFLTEEGSVISRLLNNVQSSQNFSANETLPFSAHHNHSFSHFPSSQYLAALKFRLPTAEGNVFHMSRSHDPSPSGGGAISISNPVSETKPSLPINIKSSALPVMNPKFISEPVPKPILSVETPAPQSDLHFTHFYENFSQNNLSNESSSFHNPSFHDTAVDSVQAPSVVNSKQFENETGGEFGGLASYFASQREDDLDS